MKTVYWIDGIMYDLWVSGMGVGCGGYSGTFTDSRRTGNIVFYSPITCSFYARRKGNGGLERVKSC